MRVILFFVFTLFLFLIYWAAALISNAEEKSLQGKVRGNSVIKTFGKSESVSVLLAEGFSLFIFLEVLITFGLLVLKVFPNIFVWGNAVLVLFALYFVIDFILSSLIKTRQSALINFLSFLTSFGLGYIVLTFHHWLTVDLQFFCLVLLVLVALRNISIKQFVVFGIFFLAYDLFAVFYTQQMDELINQTQGFAGNLTVPLELDMSHAFSVGIGDVVLPGALLMLADRKSKKWMTHLPWIGAFVGCTVGMVITYAIAVYFQNTQPATIYLVPCCFLGFIIAGAIRGVKWDE